MNTTPNLPGFTGEPSRNRIPMYGTIGDGKGKYAVTLEVREGETGAKRVTSTATVATGMSWRQADRMMDDLNARVLARLPEY